MNSVVLLDSGMGQELLRRSGAKPTNLWSAQVMRDAPELVQQIHVDNIRAGARVITVNAYSVTRCRLERHGVGEHFETLQRQACDLARRARDEAGVDGVRIAGCLPPLSASYRPDLALPLEQITDLCAEIARLQAPAVDVMLCETIPSIQEARGAALGARDSGKPVWMAFTTEDGDGLHLRSRELLAEAVAALGGLSVQAVLVNCSPPEAIAQSVAALAETHIPFGAYANAFTGIAPSFLGPNPTVDALKARTDLSPRAYADHAMAWIEAGASIVGGCCETGPDHTAEIARRLTDAGWTLSGELPNDCLAC